MTRDAKDARQEAPTHRHGGSALRAFYATKNPDKIKDSINDIRFFAKFCGAETEEQAEKLLFGPESSQARTQELVSSYRDHLRSIGKAYGTINRRLTTIRTLVRMARLIGAISWEIDVPAGEKTSRRDTRGVSKGALRSVKRMKDDTPRARRDKAVVDLAHHARLTRAEVIGMLLEHYDPNPVRPTISIERRRVALTTDIKKSLDAWVEVRGFKPGCLFTQHDDKRSPLTHDDVIALVRPGSVLS